ncbi:MAG: BrnT family toxin [Oligoflexia bacterium]|nr:BrnT family toxin [Oligoflexia bacterium]
MGQFKFVVWLAHWYLQQESFIFEWDQGNSTKNQSKHGVSTTDVEGVFKLRLAVALGVQISPIVNEERVCVVGPSFDGRLLSIVFTLRSGRVRPISARLASKKERELYEKVRKTIERI